MGDGAQTVGGRINDRWNLWLTPDRVDFHATRPKWEYGRLDHMASLIRPGMTIYDVGAECGDFTSLYKQWVGPSGTVIPFEPQSAYWPSIRATWEANFLDVPTAWFPGFAGDTTTVHMFAEEPLYGWPQMTWPTCSRGPIIPDVGFRNLISQEATLPQIRLDAFAQRMNIPPDAVVIDVEGAEFRVLQGCAELLRPGGGRPIFWVSVHDHPDSNPLSDWYGATRQDMHDFMAWNGYRPTDLPAHGEIERFVVYLPVDR